MSDRGKADPTPWNHDSYRGKALGFEPLPWDQCRGKQPYERRNPGDERRCAVVKMDYGEYRKRREQADPQPVLPRRGEVAGQRSTAPWNSDSQDPQRQRVGPMCHAAHQPQAGKPPENAPYRRPRDQGTCTAEEGIPNEEAQKKARRDGGLSKKVVGGLFETECDRPKQNTDTKP